MDQDSAHMVAASEVPMLKPKNGATLPKTANAEGVMTEMPITTAEEKAQRRLEDAKKLLEAEEKRFGEKLSQEDVNQKLLRSLSAKWNTHVVVWRNKADLDTMSMDDLYNNLKVYEPKVKRMSSSSSSTQNLAFVSSSNNNTSITNEVVNTAHGVSTARTQVNVANSTNIDNMRDVVICAFFASQPNSPQLIHEDLQLIHPNDMEDMYLRWQMAMLTMRARRVIRLRKGLIMHSWLSHLQTLTQSGETVKALSFEGKSTKVVRKNDDAPIIEEWVSDDEEEDVSQPKIEKKTIRPKQSTNRFTGSRSDCSGCLRHMTGNMFLSYNYDEIDGRIKAKKSVKLIMEKLFRIELELMLPSDPNESITDEAVHKELGDGLVRTATTASSLEAEQDSDKDITLVNVQDDADNEMFDVNVLNGEEVFVARQNENVVEGKRKDLQERSRNEKEANIALIEEWDNIQAKIDADHQLAERLQAQEQEELSDEEKATLFQQLLEKRRKHFVAKEQKREKKQNHNKSHRKIMCTYLKTHGGYKVNDLMLKRFDSFQDDV
ncbi:hypothetical protein Tco_1385596 [Tanacetum coccineum]